jgi:hypothetical protein
MTKLTLKGFMSELNDRLEKFTHAELKEIIRNHGMNLPPRERREYLDGFVRPEISKGKKKPEKPTMSDGEFLLREIKASDRIPGQNLCTSPNLSFRVSCTEGGVIAPFTYT